MIVQFMQSGGFAGLLKGCDVDTTDLPPEQANELRELVEASKISASGEFVSDSSRDLHQYEITIEDETSKISAIFDDQTLPPSAKPLVGYLKKCSQPKALEA
jgi:hypothetical protein